jgi:hypothetical protein
VLREGLVEIADLVIEETQGVVAVGLPVDMALLLEEVQRLVETRQGLGEAPDAPEDVRLEEGRLGDAEVIPHLFESGSRFVNPLQAPLMISNEATAQALEQEAVGLTSRVVQAMRELEGLAGHLDQPLGVITREMLFSQLEEQVDPVLRIGEAGIHVPKLRLEFFKSVGHMPIGVRGQ